MADKQSIPASQGPGFKVPAAPSQQKAPATGAKSLKTSPNSHSRGKAD